MFNNLFKTTIKEEPKTENMFSGLFDIKKPKAPITPEYKSTLDKYMSKGIEETRAKQKIFTFPEHLGGGEYSNINTKRSYAGLSTKDKQERDHIFSVFAGGTSNIENLQYLPTDKRGRQAGKVKVELDAYNKYKAGKININEARLMIATEQQKIKGLIPKQGVKSYLWEGVKETASDVGGFFKGLFKKEEPLRGEITKEGKEYIKTLEKEPHKYTNVLQGEMTEEGKKYINSLEPEKKQETLVSKLSNLIIPREEDFSPEELEKLNSGKSATSRYGEIATLDKQGNIQAIDPIGFVGSLERKIVSKIKKGIKPKITLYHGTDTSVSAKIEKNELRFGSFLTNNKEEALNYAQIRAKERGTKPIVKEFKFNKNEVSLNVGTGEWQYKGGIEKFKKGKYPEKIYKAYNEVLGTNMTKSEIDIIPFNQIRENAYMGLKGGIEEFDNLVKTVKDVIPDELAVEARKCGSAEEFVSVNKNLLSEEHYYVKTKKILDNIRKKKPKSLYEQSYFKGADKDFDRGYARYLDDNIDKLPEELKREWMTKKAFDTETGETLLGVETIRGTHWFNASADFENRLNFFKTKSQLTDIYNKAKEIKPILKAKGALETIDTADELEKIIKMKKFTTEEIAEKATKAKAIIREKGLKELKSFEIPKETYLRKLQTKLQDKMNRLDIIQRTIRKSGKTISEKADAYLKAELYIGKASSKIDDFDKNIVDPILKKLKSSKVNADEFGSYLYAKHAIERNTQIAKLGKLTSGSGMTNKQADDVIKAFEKKGNLKEVEKVANEFYENITKKRLEILEESGLMDKKAITKLRETYKNYVPLKGKEGVERLDPLGQGFSIAGKDVKRAFGRESRAENPFVRAILDYQTTVMRAEKNKVAKTFLKLVDENPNPKLWNVESLKYSPRFDKTGELISLDPKFKFADNILQVRVDGKIKMITINDPTLAKAMKNLGQEKSIKVLYTLNNYLRSVNTMMNPEFILTNFERDLQTSLINIGGEQSLKMAKNTAINIPKAMRGIWRNIRKGDKTSEWGKIYQELKTQGGKTGFFDYKSVEQKTNDLIKRIGIYNSNRVDKKMSNVIKGLGNYINDANEVVEMAVRTSSYNEALKNGFTKAKAASLAKNLTVNFNTKGNWGTMMNTLYLFSNAGIQGSTRIIRALKHKNVRKIVAGIAVGSFALNEMNKAINEEEYKKIENWEKNSNLIFMMPNGNHINIRLPYGFNIFKILGDISNEIIHKDITVGESFKRLLIALDDAYNPLSSGTPAQLLSPTLTDPIIQIGENKNWFGGPIKPDQPTFGAKKRESKLYWASVRPQTKAITEWLNKITGGSEVEAGFIDISPENIDHFFDFMTGGVGKFVSNSISSTIDITKGEFPELKNIPFARQVMKEPSEYYASGVIRKVLDKSGTEELKEKDIDKFRSSLKDRLKKEEIDTKTATRMIKDLMRNQAKLKAGKVFTEIKNANKEEKIKAVNELNELEKKEFIKILKKELKKQN